MITNKEPKGYLKTAMPLVKVFSNADNNKYFIKSNLQRRYCWPGDYIEGLYSDYIINLYDKNKEADEIGDDCVYGIIGDAILTKPEGHEREIIDMSQRITSVMAFVVVFIHLHLNNNNITDINERRALFDKYLKTKNGLSYKIISTFKDDNIEETIESFINGQFKTRKSDIDKGIRAFKETKSKEIRYKHFNEICSFVYRMVQTSIGLDCENIKDRLDLFLSKTFIQVEECSKEERVRKFMEVNTRRTEIPKQDIYKTRLCEKGDSIDAKFQILEAKVNDLTKRKLLRPVNSLSGVENILRFGFMLMDDTRVTCKNSFQLEDEKNGLEYHLNDGFLATEGDVLAYIDKCMDICDFLDKCGEYKQEGFYGEWYLLTEHHVKPNLWYFHILPSYIISKIQDEEKKKYAFKVLVNSFTLYSLRYSISSTVQYYYDYTYAFSRELLEYGFGEYSFDDFKSKLIYIYYKTFGPFINDNLTRSVKNLNYNSSQSKIGIISTLALIEYNSQKCVGRKRNNLWRYVCEKKSIEIDHIYPRSNMNSENEEFIDSIGNLTFLEQSLNASKQAFSEKTSERYGDSSFISTKLMIDGYRYEDLSNEECKRVRDEVIPLCVSKDEINNFEGNIKQRANAYAIKVRDFLTLE